jgi:hypothetical protein
MLRDESELTLHDFISGDRFPEICHYISHFYDERDQGNWSVNNQGVYIYYADTHFVNDMWSTIETNESCVVVSHNGDAAIVDENPRDCDVLAESMPDNVIAWFGQNVDTRHPKVQSLPIGLENDRWFPELSKKASILDLRLQYREPKKLLYANCTVRTNPAERQAALDACSWATVKHGRNGLGFPEYINDITDHFYTLCPRGNGIDCHRTWETLYLNRVPVMLRHRNAEFYDDLPILFVDDWEEVTVDLLESKREHFLTTAWNFDKLRFDYWKDKIHEAASR